jgi:hypothetical protein
MKKIILMLFVFLNLFAGTAFACGCAGLADVSNEVIVSAIEKEFKASSIVFSGKVTASEYIPIIENSEGVKIRAEALIFKFAVDERWKGDIGDEIIFPTSTRRYSDGSGSGGSNCVYSSFEVGKKYLIYAVGSKDNLTAHVCGRTKLIENAEKDIEELNWLKKKNDSKQKEQK